ncbi:MAG TPA: hypothetical protein DE313_01450 [Ruminococcus sp.]|nr:hypothetical protein [Ruminococcus sp.]
MDGNYKCFNTEQEAYNYAERKIKPCGLCQTETIKQYKDLLDSGAITQEEFEAKKKQLLGL